MMYGFQRKNRKSTIFVPLHEEDTLCDDYNAVMKWSENKDGFQEYLSQAFEGSCDTGMSLLHLYPDYTNDFISGELCTDQVSYNNFLIDSHFRKQDLSDCNFIWRRRWVTKQCAKALVPGFAKEIDKMRPSGLKDGRFPLQAELINLDMNRLFSYDEFYYRTMREAEVVYDPMTGECDTWEQEGEDSEDMLKMTLAQQPWLKVQKRQIPTIKMGICLGGTPIYHGPTLLGLDKYPFVPSLCYHEPDIQSYAWRVQGVIRGMRDAQYLYNMRRVIELDILQSQINSGWIYPVDVVVDPKAFRQSGQGFLIPLKAGHLPEEIKRLDPPSIPQSMLDLSQSLAEDISKISGISEELLGSSVDDKSGILNMLRQSAGLVTLQPIFDKLDYTQRLYGELRMEAIRRNFSIGKITQILGHEPDPRFFARNSMKFNVAVEEGNYTSSQRQTELQQLLHFREIGMPIANKSILQAAFITNKKKVMAEMQEQEQQQAQQQQAQAQQQSKIDNSKIMNAYSKSRVDLAKERELDASAQEKLAKVSEDLASAEHKSMQADLETVRMMIGLEDMDLENFRKSVELAQTIKFMNNPEKLQQTKQPKVSSGV